MYKGTIIPVGGNEDKGMGPNEMYTLDFIQEGILSRIVKESGGNTIKIVVITTASSIPNEVAANYKIAFATLACNNVITLDIRSHQAAEDTNNLNHIKEASCVMFSGGDQSKITKYIGGTLMHKLIMQKLKHEHFVLAGTSAGAMCMAKEMIAGGSVSESMRRGNVIMAPGLGILPEVIIDTHFIQRGRFGRLAESVAQFSDLMGIGLSEDTGLVIKNGNEAEVIGSGMALLFDARNLSHNKFNELESGTPMSLSNLTVHILSVGDRFKMKERTLEILPLEALFPK